MKKILLIGTGGTIACKRSDEGLKPVITSEEIASYVPDVNSFCDIDSVQIMNIDSTNMQPKHWLKMAETIEENYDKYDGFVICHGTDRCKDKSYRQLKICVKRPLKQCKYCF